MLGKSELRGRSWPAMSVRNGPSVRHAGHRRHRAREFRSFLDRIEGVSFAGPQAVAFDKGSLEQMYAILSYAHFQHHLIVTAIERRDGWAARKAMHTHLHNSLERVRALALASGIESTEAERVLIVACDMPNLTPDELLTTTRAVRSVSFDFWAIAGAVERRADAKPAAVATREKSILNLPV